MEPHFSGYASRSNLLCSDGRTILPGAFKHHDKQKVPLVWQHQYDSPENVLGHAVLEHRPDGIYAYGFFNDTSTGQHARTLVEHGDVKSLSIYANKLVEKSKKVHHGEIREVSLVLAGANPGAYIENVSLRHGDTYEVLDDAAVIYTGLELDRDSEQGDYLRMKNTFEIDEEAQETYDSMDDRQRELLHSMINDALSYDSEDDLSHEDDGDDDGDDEETIADVYNSMTKKQKDVVHYMIGVAVEAAENEGDENEEDGEAKQSAVNNKDEESLQHNQEGSTDMTRNVFDQSATGSKNGPSLSHDDLKTIVSNAQKMGSFKEAFLAHAEEYGIEDIDFLFPDAKALANSPQILSRRMEWVSEIINGTHHSPFAKVKTVVADITAEEARAKGYVKGNLKKEEILRLLRRVTSPTTVYKKQKLDRDDILDITDLDVVAWLKAEMRVMLEEELARAILLGDGRSYGDEEKIDEEAIRPIISDDDMYSHKVTLESNASVSDRIEALVRARSHYRGTGSPVFFTTLSFITDALLHKDKMGRRIYDSIDSLAAALMVRKIVDVEAMEEYPGVVGVFVNVADYTVGSNKGGEISMFDDFDIDYNQHKYLIETRASGALNKPKAAVVVLRQTGDPVTPISPSFDGGTNTITIPTIEGVIYTIDSETVTGDVVIEEDTEVEAHADEGYYIPGNTTTSWTFVYTE